MKPLSRPMRRMLLKVGEVNHGGLSSQTVKALISRGLIRISEEGVMLTDTGWAWWDEQGYPTIDDEEATDAH